MQSLAQSLVWASFAEWIDQMWQSRAEEERATQIALTRFFSAGSILNAFPPFLIQMRDLALFRTCKLPRSVETK